MKESNLAALPVAPAACCGAPAGSCLWPAGDRLRALLPAMPGARLHPVLWGDLSEMHVGDLFSLLHQQRRTGMLVSSCDGVERAVAVVDGDVVWARSERPEEGEEASEVIYGLIGGVAGTFTFLRAPAEALPSGPARETRHLLLDGIRRLDESRR